MLEITRRGTLPVVEIEREVEIVEIVVVAAAL